MATTITSEYLTEIARAVRVNQTTTSEQELTGLILACVADLQRQGVKQIDLDDALTKQAVKLYCKGHYGYDDGGKFLQCYEALSAAMALDVTDYGNGVVSSVQ